MTHLTIVTVPERIKEVPTDLAGVVRPGYRWIHLAVSGVKSWEVDTRADTDLSVAIMFDPTDAIQTRALYDLFTHLVDLVPGAWCESAPPPPVT